MERAIAGLFLKRAAKKKRRQKRKKISSALFAFKDSFSSLSYIRIPGWKNLTTVDKAIHINARERALGVRGLAARRVVTKNLKKVFYVLLYALVRID